MNALVEGWRLDFEHWPQAEAARHRALLGIDAQGRASLLADRPADRLLLEAAESRLARALGWQVCAPELISRWLAEAESAASARNRGANRSLEPLAERVRSAIPQGDTGRLESGPALGPCLSSG